ncbi:hypothetical protein MYA98_03735 [Salmonella sp. WGH-01]|nr:hypothetical protein MYA98_03735 [Salmonella sp. WGH-01]
MAFVANAYWAARMQTAQRIINHYRRNRFIVCTICALVTLILTLNIRFISERNLNHHRTVAFANHAVDALDNVLHPLWSDETYCYPYLSFRARPRICRCVSKPPACKPFVLSGW